MFWRCHFQGDSERFPKGFLCFVMFVAVPFIEAMGALADHVGSDGHFFAPLLLGPSFRRLQ